MKKERTDETHKHKSYTSFRSSESFIRVIHEIRGKKL